MKIVFEFTVLLKLHVVGTEWKLRLQKKLPFIFRSTKLSQYMANYLKGLGLLTQNFLKSNCVILKR